jgi:low affinity Fe/Cu permease
MPLANGAPVGARTAPNAERARGFRAWWGKAARMTVEATGSVWAFLAAVLIILAWALTGPIFRFSDTWQLVINTGTTIVTFLMVFLIQHSQNRDTKALHIKLNELIAAVEGASNRLIDVEDLDEEDLARLTRSFQELREKALAGDDEARRTVAEIAPPVDATLASLAEAQQKQQRGRPS